MKLYFTPFACSLASRIAVEEAGLDADYVQVLPGRKLPDGGDFLDISPMGYVPALETKSGITLTEGPAVLQYIADNAEEGVLAPARSTPTRRSRPRPSGFAQAAIRGPRSTSWRRRPGSTGPASIRRSGTRRRSTSPRSNGRTRVPSAASRGWRRRTCRRGRCSSACSGR